VVALQWFGGVYQDPSNFFANFAVEPEHLAEVFQDQLQGIPASRLKEFVRDREGCVVGESLARKFGWHLGTVVPLQGTIFPMNPRLTIRAIYKARRASDELALYFQYKLLEETIPFMKGKVGNFWIRARRPEDVPRLIERIDRHFHDAVDPTYSETENAFQLEFLRMLGNYGAMIHTITLAVLVAVLIVTANTMAMAIRERGTEIAVFRAMGFRSVQVLSILLSEGVLLSLMGGLLGMGLATLAAIALRQALGGAFPFMADFAIPPDILVLCLNLTLGTGLLSTFIPAYGATRRPIVEGLRAL
jgi:putative ABC transport system permease protein